MMAILETDIAENRASLRHDHPIHFYHWHLAIFIVFFLKPGVPNMGTSTYSYGILKKEKSMRIGSPLP